MTRQADFKRRVRARMAKTGESYAAARGRLLAERPGETRDFSALDWVPGALHISNGDATDIPGTGLARRVIYWRDVLHEGPVPDVPPAELRRIRVDYLTGYQGVERGETMRQFTERDRALEAGRDGEYVLWFEADLYDQLQIAEILARLADLGVPAERITLICIGEHAGIARFGGLGELTADQLRELPHTNACARLTQAALELATRAWAAFTRAAARETRPYMGDTTCFGRMDRMAQGPHPLLHLDPPGRPVQRATGLRLTDAGARVLAGQADQIVLAGIDWWIGGVHLHGHHVPWRWDDGTEAIVHLADRT